MGNIFDGMLKEGESLFKNLDALDFEFVPKLLPYRENQQHYIAGCIKPLLQGRNGKNLFIFGAPGIGKTAAIKWVLRDLEEHSDDVVPVYINCWQKNTTYKIVVEMCGLVGYKFTQNKKTEELFRIVKERLNKKAVVFAFDEIDKVEDFDFLYSILEEIYKKTVLLITNYREKLDELDERIRSRLLPEILEFPQYNRDETAGILKERMKLSFVSGVWEKDAFDLVAEKTADIKDIRCGLYLMRAAGMIAEDNEMRKIMLAHAKSAIQKLPEFTVKDKDELDDESQSILSIVKENSGKKIGDLFKVYQEKGGTSTYKTFQRRISKLSENRFISTEKITGGKDGTTTIVSVEKEKKLTEF
ncbi:AAA family ATPase [Candidatus Woesearchaeota archaeon]|nr:AAA family ATPase [Candidatus Woesearchaeota archaeon]